MFKNVLVGVDGLSGGRDAIALASRFTDPDGEMTLAHVQCSELLPSHRISPGVVREERERSRELLAREREATDVRAELVNLVATSPGRGLHERAEEQFADLLVVGSTSRGVFGRAALGDDTRAALNGAPCAVAIAPRGYAERMVEIANVGVAYDGSPESELALAMGRRLAGPTEATVHALEVVSVPSYAYTGLMPAVTGAGVDVMLSEANARMNDLSGVEGRAVYGIAGEELAAFSGRLDLLIVGSRGYGPVRRLVLGSTSNFLERHARSPLLVLPRGVGVGAADGPLEADQPVAVTA